MKKKVCDRITPDSVGDWICIYRKAAGLTQSDLAVKCGVSKNSVSNWESGLYFPSVSHLLAMCRIFDVDLFSFFY